MASCYRCGRTGHGVQGCQMPPGTRPTCRRCGGWGHLREHCPTWAPCDYSSGCERITLERYDGEHCPGCGMPRPDDPCRLHEHTTAAQAEINGRGQLKVLAARAEDWPALERLAAVRH